MAKASNSSMNLMTFLRQSPIEESITRAEVLFANFIAEHNLPFLLADHFTRLTSVMFPDSQIAKSFKSGHTKTTCIVNGALQPHFATPVEKLCQENPFSVLCDEGSDTDDKNFAILVRLWDENVGQPITRFLDMPICNIGTADKLFEAIDTALEEKSHGLMSLGLNQNVMVGKHNSVLSRVKSKQPGVFQPGICLPSL